MLAQHITVMLEVAVLATERASKSLAPFILSSLSSLSLLWLKPASMAIASFFACSSTSPACQPKNNTQGRVW